MLRIVIGGIVALLLALTALLWTRTTEFGPGPAPAPYALKDPPRLAINVDDALLRLGKALQFQTIAGAPPAAKPASDSAASEPAQADRAEPEPVDPFVAQRQFLEASYPAIHYIAERELLNGEAQLFTWKGTDQSLPPILLLAHLDVVPAEDPESWLLPPFSGVLQQGYVWGRGAIDDKGAVIAILEAANALAAQGFKPRRTILLAFGNDEETDGKGAQAIAARLKSRGVRAWFALDEGAPVLESHPMTGRPAAMIGVAEKGYGTLRVTATAEAGHSSAPSGDTAITLLSEAILRISGMPVVMALSGGPTHDMLRALSDDLPLTTRVAVANEWLFGPLVNAQLAADPAAAATARTTIAPTMLRAGEAENVLPPKAEALINIRLHPRDTSGEILAGARRAVSGVPGVEVEWASAPSEATPVASTTSDAYRLISAWAGSLHPEAKVAPWLLTGGTDARHYQDVAENVYRFTPTVQTVEELGRMHGMNERLSRENFSRMIDAYAQLMATAAGP